MSIEAVDRLDYPFAERFGQLFPAHARVQAVRVRTFDREVEDFLRQSPNGTVVALGEGLETQFWRVDNGSVRWLASLQIGRPVRPGSIARHPNQGFDMSLSRVLANSTKILANQSTIRANQARILRNQDSIRGNQKRILANQGKIQANQGKLDQMENSIQSGAADGMCTMDGSLKRLMDSGTISGEEAYMQAFDKKKFEEFKNLG